MPVGTAAVVAAAAPLFMSPTPVATISLDDGAEHLVKDDESNCDGDPPQNNVIMDMEDDEQLQTPQREDKVGTQPPAGVQD